ILQPGNGALQRGALPLARHPDQAEELVARPVEIELELAVLVHRAQRADRRLPLALLAQALGPELAVPEAEGAQAVAVGEEHLLAGARLQPGDAERGALHHRRLLAAGPQVPHDRR